MKDAKDFLKEFIEQSPISSRLEEQGLSNWQQSVYALWPSVLKQIHLEQLSLNSQVSDFSNGELVLFVTHPAFSQEIKLQQRRWQPLLEKAMKENEVVHPYIKKVTCRVQTLAAKTPL